MNEEDSSLQKIGVLMRESPSLLRLALDPHLAQYEQDETIKKIQTYNLTEAVPTLPEVSPFLKTADFRILSLEIELRDTFGLEAGFGLQHITDPGQLPEADAIVLSAEEFVSIVLQEITNFTDFPAFISALNQRAGGQKEQLLERDPTFIEIGVVEHWHDIDRCLLWQNGQEKKLTELQLDKLLEPHYTVEGLGRPNQNYQALNIVYKKTAPGLIYHWLRFQCGIRKTDDYMKGLYILDHNRILELLHSLLDFMVTDENQF